MPEDVTFIKRIIISVSNPELYKLLLKHGQGKAISYLLIICLILGSLSLIQPLVALIGFIDDVNISFNNDIPEFTYNNGVLSIDGEQPIVLDDKNLLYIDTTIDDYDSVLSKYDKGSFIFKDKLIEKTSSGITTTDMKEIIPYSFTKSDVMKFVPYLKILSILFAIFFLAWYTAGKFISALIVAALASLIFKKELLQYNFGQIYTISIYCLTTPILVKLVINTFTITIPFFFIIYYGIALLYLYLSVSKRDSIQEH